MNRTARSASVVLGLALVFALNAQRAAAELDFEALRLAILDLQETFGSEYPEAPQLLAELESIERDKSVRQPARFTALKRAALVRLNPLLDFDRLLLLKRKKGQLGLPVNHKCNGGRPEHGGVSQDGFDNELVFLSPVAPDGSLTTLYRPRDSSYVGEMDLHFDGDRILFTMPQDGNWHVHELALEGGAPRRVTPNEHPDIAFFDACYLPDGGVALASTASYTAVPCWHGQERACTIFRMDPDGTDVRQLCFDQDLDLHPSVLNSGQIVFSRWDYTGIMHIYLRPLMAMNPDGTGQRALYGSNSYWPNSIYFPRAVPGSSTKLVAIVSGYHGVSRMGQLALLDTAKGWRAGDGVVKLIPGPLDDTKIVDRLVDKDWPKFLHPFPLSDKYFLAAAQKSKNVPWSIYLVDVFGNMTLVHGEEGYDFFEPIPVRKTLTPPALPDRTDPARDDALVYLHNIYEGPGLAGVPRGTIEKLRVVAYHYGYPGLAGPDKIGCGGPWEVMRILGTVPVDEDGSTVFRVPANTPLALQPLDTEGKAVQLMRSWFTAMPGEVVSCVGCHEEARDVPATRFETAALRTPHEIEPWRGPPRGFDFERDVQPVLDRYCVGCHDGTVGDDGAAMLDLRAERFHPDYRGRLLTTLGVNRLHEATKPFFPEGRARYTPAYEALIPYIRRVNVEDDVDLLTPGEYHADTSPLIQMLKKGHHGVRLDQEAWDRLVTWIDLNGPCHGSWSDICPVPDRAIERRRELALQYAGLTLDPEAPVAFNRPKVEPIVPDDPMKKPAAVPAIDDWPLTAHEAQSRQQALGESVRWVDLDDGAVRFQLVRVPAGRFVMGDPNGQLDERPLRIVTIDQPFWIGRCEVTNRLMRWHDPNHKAGRFTKRFVGGDGPGLSLDGDQQPAVRVSWDEATAFCRRLSEATGMHFDLPTEAQWEYAARAGSETPLNYGGLDVDFAPHANLADESLALRPGPTGGLETNVTAHFGKGIFASAVFGSNIMCDDRFNDGNVATANVGCFRPNAWGLCDTHGNAAEWTRSEYTDRVAERTENGPRMVVRGGSWCDRPKDARSAVRLTYPAWQRVHNVGFRVVCEEE